MEPLPYQSAPARTASRATRRYWRMLTALVLVSGAAGYLYASRGSGSFHASTTILVRALVGNAYSAEASTTQAATVALETEAQLVHASQVADRVQRSLPGICNKDAVTAEVLTNTQLVKVTAAAGSADAARQCAQAYATGYLARRQEIATVAQSNELDALNQQLSATEKTLAEATAIANGPNPPPGATSRVEGDSALLTAIQTQIGQIKAQPIEPGNIVVSATGAPKATGLSPAMSALGGAAGGLLVGLLIAIGRERRRQRLLAAADIDVPGLPTLAMISATDAVHLAGVASGQVLARLPDPADDEEFRQAAVKLLAHVVPKSIIAVTSLSIADVTAAPTLRLARALAAAGYQVAVVEAVTQAPQVAALLEVGARAGLSEVLSALSDRPPPVVIAVAGLTVVTAGEEPAKSGPYFPGPRMNELLAQLKDDHDFVLMATGAMNTADGLGPLLAADEAVLVVPEGGTRQADIERAQAMAERLGAHLLGLVVLGGQVRPVEPSSVPSVVPAVAWPGTLPQPSPVASGRAPYGVTGTGSEQLDPAERTVPGGGRF
jgi:Mrp family chromosome partitioning ATPase/capsular polysaccharide biosynthesis protein